MMGSFGSGPVHTNHEGDHVRERGYWACVDGASYGPFDTRAEANAVRADWDCDSWTEPERCICEHEPHDGECPEMVRSIIGAPWPCGCDEYCPDRNYCYCGEPHPDDAEHDSRPCVHCEALCRHYQKELP